MRRIDDDIRSICDRLLATNSDKEARPIVVELKTALETKIRRLRFHLANYPLVIDRRAKRNSLLDADNQDYESQRIVIKTFVADRAA